MNLFTELLKDGVGYDSTKNLFFTVNYAWQNIGVESKDDTFVGKSGITKYDVMRAMQEAVPTRGKQFAQNPLWGFECDRKYLPKGITEVDANKVVLKMDYFFKEDMKEIGWNLRDKKKCKELGTEFYEGTRNIWLETIKQKWEEAFIRAKNVVLGVSDKVDLGDSTVMGSQGIVTEQINEVLNFNEKVRVIIPCGYGKGFLMFYGGFKWEKFKNKKTLVYYGHNIPATKQLAVKHAEYADGTMYHGQIKRIVVCSEKKSVKGQEEYGIENYSVTDSKLDEIIKEHIKSPQRIAFYVNKMSAGVFNNKFNEIAKKLDYDCDSNVGSIIDEEQEFCGHKSSAKTDAVQKPITKNQVSFTATERRRGGDTNEDRIYNDDIQHFGVIAIEITPSQTIDEGRSCPIHFKTVEVSDNHSLMNSINKNKIIETVFGDETSLEVRGRLLRGIISLVKSINEDNRTHPLMVTSLRVDTEDAIRLINNIQKHGIIPKDYVIVRAFREDGLDDAKKFNKLEKGIMVGTPWIITGIDAPNIDGFIPLYDMGSEITATQGIGRGQRPVDGKDLIVYIPVNPDDTNIPVMLRVANNFIAGENSHNVGEETVVQETDEVLGSPQKRRITSEIDRDMNSEPNLRIYWDKIYEDLVSNRIGRASNYCERYNEEKIEELYRKFENKSFSELNISSHSHPIQMARDLGIHDGLMKKYNIFYKHHRNKTEEEFKKLLDCKTKKDVREKPYGAIYQSLLNTKDNVLIEKYSKHLEQLRIRKYTEENLEEFFNSLSLDSFPEINRENKDFHGKYRVIFNRGKDEWYDKILKKWGDKVPMEVLKDDDKLKRIEKLISECKDYTDWYKKYVSSHKKILKRLNRLDLLDGLKKNKILGRNLTDIIEMAKVFQTRKEFQKKYPADFAWIQSKDYQEVVFSHIPLTNGWDKRTKK